MGVVSTSATNRGPVSAPTQEEIKEIMERLWRVRMLLEDAIMRTPSGENRNWLCDSNIDLVRAASTLKMVRESL
jgi:hypothetical protein